MGKPDWDFVIRDRIKYPFSLELKSIRQLLRDLIHHKTCECHMCERIRNKIKVFDLLLFNIKGDDEN